MARQIQPHSILMWTSVELRADKKCDFQPKPTNGVFFGIISGYEQSAQSEQQPSLNDIKYPLIRQRETTLETRQLHLDSRQGGGSHQ